MKQPDFIDDEELILYYYGESERAGRIEAALETSSELGERFRELSRILDAVEAPPAPARGELYGHEVWKRVYPRLEDQRPQRRVGGQLRRVAGWAIAATLLVAVSFWAGRETAPPTPEAIALSEQARDRILLVEVGNHLERSQFLLLELRNAGAGSLDAEQLESARRLKADSRLYRQAARTRGEDDLAYVLEELELFLTELAHLGPDASGDMDALLDRLEDNNLIFKVRILESRIEERTKPPAEMGAGGPTV